MTGSAYSTCSTLPEKRCAWLLDVIALRSMTRTILSQMLWSIWSPLSARPASKVSSGTCSELGEIPWPDVIGMRNRLIHAYFDINLDILWATVQDSLPSLIQALESALAEDEEV